MQQSCVHHILHVLIEEYTTIEWNETTVAEIATANNISQDNATEKFFSHVQKQHDDKLGFELELQSLKSEFQKSERMQLELNDKAAALNFIILKQPIKSNKYPALLNLVPW